MGQEPPSWLSLSSLDDSLRWEAMCAILIRHFGGADKNLDYFRR
jgi:hypothetical protein